MSGDAVLAAAAAHWSRLSGRLPDETREWLAALLREMRAAPPGGTRRAAAAAEAARLVQPWLSGEGARFTGTVPPAGFTADDLAVLVLDGHAMVGPVFGPVRERLLATPALDAVTVERYGGDPYAPGLIRLRAPGGRHRLPGFQFAEAAVAWPVVLEVNGLLNAERDPWGTADWWLSANAWLGVSPAGLLGTGRDAQLADTARYLAEGE